MSIRDSINNEYFEWLFDKVCGDLFADDISYRKLFMLLHNTPFRYSVAMDKNRLADGLSLRNRFVNAKGYAGHMVENIGMECSVLEVMVALSIRMEESIMDNARIGDRTSQWFWGMISSLGLSGMTDDEFDKIAATRIIDTFLDREYAANGKGGLFTIKNCEEDLRDVQIWSQMCWYLDCYFEI